MREPDYAAHPPLDRLLTLPSESIAEPADAARAADAWSAALGGALVLLVRSVDRARALLLETAGVQVGEPVVVPANATQALVDVVKARGAVPRFAGLDADLALTVIPNALAGPPIVWVQPVGGLPGLTDIRERSVWVDHHDSLPHLGAVLPAAQVVLWGLHLSPDPAEAGALLWFATPDSPSSYQAAIEARLTAEDLPDPARALAQCRRLTADWRRASLARRQLDALDETWRGLREAAGLELVSPSGASALPHHLAVRIPGECDAAKFYAYVRGENTPVRWLPLERPVHHAALRSDQLRATAAHLARWLLVPVGPDYTDAEISHAVLGVVKASEYLGVRWRTEPARAAAYAQQLNACYGPNHDAYRPIFLPTG